MRRFNNPFGWDWMPRNEEVFDITSGTNWSFNAPWAFHYDKFDELRKVAKTFEDIKKVEINLTFDLDPKQKELTEKDIPLKKRNRLGYKHNQLKSIGNKFYINVNTTDERYLTTEAKLDHNVSHILYDSPIKESRQHAHRLSLGHGIPELLRDEKLAISPDCNLCEDVIRHVFDILEDVRVNSLWGDIYMGTQNDYDECKDKVKKQLKKPITNPIQALWYAANGKTDDSEMSKIALQFINDIKHTDYPAGPLLQKAYFEEVILPWLKEQTFDDDKQSKKDKSKNSKQQQENKKSDCDNSEERLKTQLKEIANEIKRIRDQHNATPDHRGLEIELINKKRKTIDKLLKDAKIPTMNISSVSEKMDKDDTCTPRSGQTDGKPIGEFNDKPGVGGGQGKSYDMYDPKTIEKLKSRGRERNDKLRNKLVSKGLVKDKTLEAYNFDPDKFDVIARSNVGKYDGYVIDYSIAERLKRVWRQARGATSEIVDEEGEEIDLDAYIQEIPSVYKDNNIFTNEKSEPGLHIVYSADCCGSMDGYPLSLLRNVTATIKKSLEQEPKIKMSMIGWGGGHKTGISIHTTMDDIDNFTVNDDYGGTPESNALWYSSTWLQRQPEPTKVIFFVSDGAFSQDAAKEQVEIARENGLNVFGIGICSKSIENQYRYIFGADSYTIIDGSEHQGMNMLTSDIAKFISRHIKAVA